MGLRRWLSAGVFLGTFVAAAAREQLPAPARRRPWVGLNVPRCTGRPSTNDGVAPSIRGRREASAEGLRSDPHECTRKLRGRQTNGIECP